jgi:SpoIID/LytB domain protein
MRKVGLFLIVFFCLIFITPTLFVRADELEDINKEIEVIKYLLNESKKASEPLEQNLSSIQQKVSFIEGKLTTIGLEVEKKAAEIRVGEKELIEQKKIIDQRAKKHYIQSRSYLNNLLALFLTKNIQDASRSFFYHRQGLQKDRDVILKIAFFITDLEKKKQSLEEEKLGLASARAELDKQKTFFQEEVAKAKNYQSELETKIAELSAKQQELIAKKISSVPLPRSAQTTLSGCVPDLSLDGGTFKDPGFGGTKYGFFSYGVPNKTGLNQYGAKGRAEQEQDYEEILRAYYNFDSIQDGFSVEIRVNNGNGFNQGDVIWTGSLEDYLKRIYEMPGDWHQEALRAQVIAARSYVLAATNNGSSSICANEHCQIFKDVVKTGQWEQAVIDTSGKAMVQGGTPVKAWFSSTHGGVVLESSRIGWKATSWTKNLVDATSANSFDELKNNAYDRQSPWFYCDWGYRSQHNNTAWLSHDEVLDIINAFLLYEKDNNTITHLSQTDKDIPDTWSAEKVRQELGTPITSISSISVDWSSDGISSTIRINGAGYNAQTFKNIFNMRAPANIQIKPACNPNDGNLSNDCAYALYNIEIK